MNNHLLGRSSDLLSSARAFPSSFSGPQWQLIAFRALACRAYSSGTVWDFHPIPYYVRIWQQKESLLHNVIALHNPHMHLVSRNVWQPNRRQKYEE